MLVGRVSHPFWWYLGTKWWLWWQWLRWWQWWGWYLGKVEGNAAILAWCLWRRRGVHQLKASEVSFKIAPVQNGVGAGWWGQNLTLYGITFYSCVLYLFRPPNAQQPWSRSTDGYVKRWGFGREWEFLLPFLVEEWFLYRKEGKALLSCLRLISRIPSKHNHPTILYKRSVGTLEVHGLSATFAHLPGTQTERLGLNGHKGMVRHFFPHRSHGYSVLCQDLLTLWGVSAFGPLGGKGAKPQKRYREGTHSLYVWRKKALEPSGNKEKE